MSIDALVLIKHGAHSIRDVWFSEHTLIQFYVHFPRSKLHWTEWGLLLSNYAQALSFMLHFCMEYPFVKWLLRSVLGEAGFSVERIHFNLGEVARVGWVSHAQGSAEQPSGDFDNPCSMPGITVWNVKCPHENWLLCKLIGKFYRLWWIAAIKDALQCHCSCDSRKNSCLIPHGDLPPRKIKRGMVGEHPPVPLSFLIGDSVCVSIDIIWDPVSICFFSSVPRILASTLF